MVHPILLGLDWRAKHPKKLVRHLTCHTRRLSDLHNAIGVSCPRRRGELTAREEESMAKVEGKARQRHKTQMQRREIKAAMEAGQTWEEEER